MTHSAADDLNSFSVVIDEPLTQLGAERLLRGFDRARRGLAQRLVGAEGAGAGYDSVHVDWTALRAVSAGSVLTVTAMLTERRGRRHLVEYVATAADPSAEVGVGRTRILASAQGWTLTDCDSAAISHRGRTERAVIA